MARRRSPSAPAPRVLDPAEVRARLLHAAALDRPFPAGAPGARALLAAVGAIQLDPIDRLGTNAELVAFARVDGLRRGELHGALAGEAFEHFAKERCLLHARAFPWYRDRVVETAWWRHQERAGRLDAALLDEVYAELVERGPAPPDALTDRGRVEPMDWSGWKSTASRTAMTLEVLWTTCRVVTAGRDARGRRVYDVPDRALGAWAAAPAAPDATATMVVERVRAAGLLARAAGPTWSMLHEARTDGTVDRLLDEGRLEAVSVGASSRSYLVAGPPPTPAPPDERLRVLGPLDALLWDRELVRAAFGFDYVWEVYKPAAQRRWGWYVCPLLHRGALVGRVEARRAGPTLVVDRWWEEQPGAVDRGALGDALDRLAQANRCERWTFTPGAADPA